MRQTLKDRLFVTFYFNESSKQILKNYSITVVHKLLSFLKIEVGEDLQKTNRKLPIKVYC